jgi:hypothetical protein
MQKSKCGRKPVTDKKKPITIYIPLSKISDLGGSDEIRNQLLNFLNQQNGLTRNQNN